MYQSGWRAYAPATTKRTDAQAHVRMTELTSGADVVKRDALSRLPQDARLRGFKT